MINDWNTQTSSNASWWDKLTAVGDLALNEGMDVSMFTGVGEGLKIADISAHLAEMLVDHSRGEVAEHAGESATETIGRGTSEEIIASKPVKESEALSKWNDFLGEGPYTDTHPRTGLADPNRIVSRDGTRSIRFEEYEVSGRITKWHYHEEMWTYDPDANVMNVKNTLNRLIMGK